MRDLDFSGADACIMVYAIDKESTFNEMPEIKQLADTHCKPPPLYFLVGNKVDLEREGRRAVEDEDGKDFKKEEKLTYFCETNANDQQHIENLFNVVKDQLLKVEESKLLNS